MKAYKYPIGLKLARIEIPHIGFQYIDFSKVTFCLTLIAQRHVHIDALNLFRLGEWGPARAQKQQTNKHIDMFMQLATCLRN